MSEMIEKMRALGKDVSWYYQNKRVPSGDVPPAKCSRLSLFLLEGTNSYTVQSNGSAYAFWKELKKPVSEPVYYCSACRKRWSSWEEALDHPHKEKDNAGN